MGTHPFDLNCFLLPVNTVNFSYIHGLISLTYMRFIHTDATATSARRLYTTIRDL